MSLLRKSYSITKGRQFSTAVASSSYSYDFELSEEDSSNNGNTAVRKAKESSVDISKYQHEHNHISSPSNNRGRLDKLRQMLKSESESARTFKNFTKKHDTTSSSLKDEENIQVIHKMINKLKETEDSLVLHPPVMSLVNSPEMLTDRYSRVHSYLRISLVEKCNLRCQYCMPPEGVPLQQAESLLSSEEIMRLVHLFADAGVDKIRLTGGEPLLRRDIVDLVYQISSIPSINSVGITTNAITLSRHIQELVDAGLTHVNVSLDTLKEDKFLEITRRNGLSKVLRGIDQACDLLPDNRVKINSVVMKGFNDMELRDFVELARYKSVDARFIEWMPFNDNGWNKDRFFSYKDMLSRITEATYTGSLNGLPPYKLDRISDSANDTTKWYRVPGYKGRVGFITSMSEHFCGTCNRLRITADGQLKVCLFGSHEVSLRDAMRAGLPDDDLSLLVKAAVQKKKFALGGHGDMHGIKKANDNRPMTLIGG